MQIPEAEGRLFYHLFGELMRFGNRRLQAVDDEDLDSNFGRIAPETRMRIRDAVFQHPEIIDDFVRENPSHLSAEELATVARWKNFVAGTFYVYRYLKQHTIFMGGKKHDQAFGVLALADSIEVVLEAWPLPAMVRTVLLPWRDKIIYDGLMWRYQILVGNGVRDQLDEYYRKVKEGEGIVLSLPRRAARGQTVRSTARKTPPRHRGANGAAARGSVSRSVRNGASNGNGAHKNGSARTGARSSAAANGSHRGGTSVKAKRKQKVRR